MTEILTESFCERCGTRYTFESAAPRQRRMGGLKVLGRGLKNFVMSDDSSLDEAFASARFDVERDATSHQLDAFHRTFNFCMSCRQYTCANCWNEIEARCLSCAPLAITEPAPVLDAVDPERLRRLVDPYAADELVPTADPFAAEDAHPHAHAPEMIGAETREARDATYDAGDAAEAAGPPAEDLSAAALATPPTIEALERAPEPVASEPADITEPTIGGLWPGQTIDDAVAAYEASQAADETAEAAEPVAAATSTVDATIAVAAVEESQPVAAVEESQPVAAANDAAREAVADVASPFGLPAAEAEPPATVADAPADDIAAAAAPLAPADDIAAAAAPLAPADDIAAAAAPLAPADDIAAAAAPLAPATHPAAASARARADRVLPPGSCRRRRAGRRCHWPARLADGSRGIADHTGARTDEHAGPRLADWPQMAHGRPGGTGNPAAVQRARG